MRIYNTLTRQKDEFTPITPGEVKMYVCGQTVYNYIHMGNARFYVAFDAIRRYLEYKGYKVRFVQNFTDVDDKIIRRAAEEGVPAREIAEKYIAETLKDMDALNIERATVNPRATADMPDIIAMIQTLVDKGYAYEKNGSVFFEAAKAAEYGKLSKKNIDDLEAGARVEVNADKRNPMDFVLWKPDKPGEPKWESPWGTGRPGWHIECSAMVKKYLGDTIDIHGGGEDLIFPHHENEIAQSESANGTAFAHYWMHNGTVTMGRRKMAKSTGNFRTLREVAAEFPYDVIRFYLLSGHYRMPMEYGETLLAAAQKGLSRIKNADSALRYIAAHTDKQTQALTDSEAALLADGEGYRRAFEDAMDNDFNTADAVTAIFELVRFINTHIDINRPGAVSRGFVEGLKAQLTLLCDILGIKLEPEPRTEPKSYSKTTDTIDVADTTDAIDTTTVADATDTIDTTDATDTIDVADTTDAIDTTDTIDVADTTDAIDATNATDATADVRDQRVQALIAERQEARKQKDWSTADKIRDVLLAEGIMLEDTANGVRWSYKRV